MGLFSKRLGKVVTSDEAVQKIATLVNEREFQKLQSKLKGMHDSAYRTTLKRWAIEHEDPEVNKVGRAL